MNNEGVFNHVGLRASLGTSHFRSEYLERLSISRKVVIGVILVVALLAFELFNFDTTRYALEYLLGEVQFWGLRWATILAIAFCAIDFAGLARLFTPEQGDEEPRTVWYLMGAWLLGATMNAVMTWWAVSLTLLTHDFGNEVLSREQLLEVVPIFVAALVWLTRILFIGALSVAGDHLFNSDEHSVKEHREFVQRPPATHPGRPRPAAPNLRMARGATDASRGSMRRPHTIATPRPVQTRGRQSYRRPVPGNPRRSELGLQARQRR